MGGPSVVSTSPCVSVVIPTYSHREYVLQAVNSVRSQTFTDYEIIVVNDGSPDDTDELLRPLVRSGEITTYISQENAGQGAARNRGISEARGEFVVLLDDDDCLPRDRITWQVEALRSHADVGVVYGYPQPVDAEGNFVEPHDAYNSLPTWPWKGPSGDVYTAMTQRCWIVSPGQAMIRRCLLDNAAFDPVIRGCDDWDLWLRIAENHRFLFEDRLSLLYRLHGSNASRDTLTMRRNDFRLLHKHLRRNLLRPGRLCRVAYRYAAFVRWTPVMLLEQAERDISEGRTAHARAKLRYALRFRPGLVFRQHYRLLWRDASGNATSD